MSNAWKVLCASLLLVAALVALLVWRPGSAPDDTSGAPLVLYCAAGVKPPVEAIAREYGKAYGVEVQLQYGGSGTLLANIQVARAGDLYVAADAGYAEAARRKDLVAEIIPMAWQRPVIAVAKGNPRKILTTQDLLRDDVRVALGSPDAAAVGKLTRDIFQRSGEWDKLERHVKEKGVFKPTVPEVANDVKLHTVDAGIVWDSTVSQYPELEAVRVPAFENEKSHIAICVLTSCRQPSRALRFARYMTARDRRLLTFKGLGYDVVEGDAWAEHPEIVLFSGGVNRVAIEQTVKAFELREGVTVITNYKGCGLLVGEMKTGKHPDAYFACDTSYMKEVEPLFLDTSTISETDMVLLTEKGNPKNLRTLGDLTRPGVKVAVANPSYSALGGLTRRLLDEAGLYEAVKANITYGDSPTADYLTVRVKTGREDVAIVYRANTVNLKGELEVIPIEHAAAKAIQPIAVGKESKHRQLMGRLVDAIKSAESRKRFETSGFRWLAGEPPSHE